MTTPGLTCTRCETDLYPALARATDDGWAHTVCAGGETCQDCGQTIIPRTQWNNLTDAERAEHRARRIRPKSSSRCCRVCANTRARRNVGTNEAAERRAAVAQRRADRLEDIRWMCDTGESFDGACTRLGLTDDGLRMFLRRAGERQMLLTLLRRNPVDANSNAGAAREAWFERVAA